jgi:hypothetical protein
MNWNGFAIAKKTSSDFVELEKNQGAKPKGRAPQAMNIDATVWNANKIFHRCSAPRRVRARSGRWNAEFLRSKRFAAGAKGQNQAGRTAESALWASGESAGFPCFLIPAMDFASDLSASTRIPSPESP